MTLTENTENTENTRLIQKINSLIEQSASLDFANLNAGVRKLNVCANRLNGHCQTLEEHNNNHSGSDDDSNLEKLILETYSSINEKFSAALSHLILEGSKEISNQITETLSSCDEHKVNALLTHIKTREISIPAMLKADSAIHALFTRINSSAAESKMTELTESNKQTYEAIAKQVDDALNAELDAIQKQIEKEDKAFEAALKPDFILSDLHPHLITWFDFATKCHSKLQRLSLFPSQMERIKTINDSLLLGVWRITGIYTDFSAKHIQSNIETVHNIIYNIIDIDNIDNSDIIKTLDKKNEILKCLDDLNSRLKNFDLVKTKAPEIIVVIKLLIDSMRETYKNQFDFIDTMAKNSSRQLTERIKKVLTVLSARPTDDETFDARVTKHLTQTEFLKQYLDALKKLDFCGEIKEIHAKYCSEITDFFYNYKSDANAPITMGIAKLESTCEAIIRALKDGREFDAKQHLAYMENIKKSVLRIIESGAILSFLRATNPPTLNLNDEHNKIVSLYEKASNAISAASEAKLNNSTPQPLNTDTGKLDEAVQGEKSTNTTTLPSSNIGTSEDCQLPEKSAEIIKREKSLLVFDQYVATLAEKKKTFSKDMAIYHELEGLLKTFEDKKCEYINNSACSQDAFKSDIKKAIESSEPELRTHRTTKPLLRAILVFLQQLGQVFNRHSVFATTDTMKKTRNVLDALDDLDEPRENSSCDQHYNKTK